MATTANAVATKRIGFGSTISSLLRLLTVTVDKVESIIVTNLGSIEELSKVGLEEAQMVRSRSQIENAAEIKQLKADLKSIEI